MPRLTPVVLLLAANACGFDLPVTAPELRISGVPADTVDLRACFGRSDESTLTWTLLEPTPGAEAWTHPLGPLGRGRYRIVVAARDSQRRLLAASAPEIELRVGSKALNVDLSQPHTEGLGCAGDPGYCEPDAHAQPAPCQLDEAPGNLISNGSFERPRVLRRGQAVRFESWVGSAASATCASVPAAVGCQAAVFPGTGSFEQVVTILEPGPHCLSLKWHIVPTDSDAERATSRQAIATFAGVEWPFGGEPGDGYRRDALRLELPAGDQVLQFEALPEDRPQSSLLVDDVALFPGDCPSNQ